MPAPIARDADVLLIDGRSGSGKTRLAARVCDAWRAAGREPQLLRVEDLYPGWDGLAAGSRDVAAALAAEGYRRYDWVAGRFGERVRLARLLPLVIEGCGALTRENLAAARDWASRAAGAAPAGRTRTGVPEPVIRSVWLECPEPLRRARALARDGDAYAPHWERWAAQEDAHYAAVRPWELADEAVRS